MKLKCIKCNSPLMKPGEAREIIALVCGNEKCERYGLLTVVGAHEESPIIPPTPNTEIIKP